MATSISTSTKTSPASDRGGEQGHDGLFERVKWRSHLFFLFFGGAAPAPFPCAGRGWALASWQRGSLQMPRRRKPKRMILGASVAINRPPLRGFKPSERWSQECGQCGEHLGSATLPTGRPPPRGQYPDAHADADLD